MNNTEEVKCIVDSEQYYAMMDNHQSNDTAPRYCYCPDCGCNQAYDSDDTLYP